MIVKYDVLDIKNDLILDENFWREYRLIFGYETLEIGVKDKD